MLYVDWYRWEDSWEGRWARSDYLRATHGPPNSQKCTFLSPAALEARDVRYSNTPVRLSVCLSVRPSRLVFALWLENALIYFLKILQVRAPCHGGALYSFWYWWNVVWIFYEIFQNFVWWGLHDTLVPLDSTYGSPGPPKFKKKLITNFHQITSIFYSHVVGG